MADDSPQNPMAVTSFIEPANNATVNSPVKFYAMVEGVFLGEWPYELKDITNNKMYTGNTQILVGMKRTLELAGGSYTFGCRIKVSNSSWTDWGYVSFVAKIITPVIDLPNEGESTGRQPTFTGRGTPGASLRLVKAHDANTVWSETVKIPDTGTWTVGVNRELPFGRYSMTAEQVYFESTLYALARTINVTAPPPTITLPSSGSLVSNPLKFKGAGSADATIVVVSSSNHSIAYSDGIKVPVSGLWEVSAKNSLSGLHSVQAQQTDHRDYRERDVAHLRGHLLARG